MIVPAQNSSYIRIAQQNRNYLFVVPQQAVFFVGGLFEERQVAEDDDWFFVFQGEVEFFYEPFELAASDGSAVEGGFDGVAVVGEKVAVGFGLGFVDGGNVHAVEDNEAGAVLGEGVVETVEAHDRFVALGRDGEAVVACDVIDLAGEAGEHVAYGDEVGLGFGAFAADEVAELDDELRALTRPLLDAPRETGLR